MPRGGNIGQTYGDALLEARARSFALRDAQVTLLLRAFQDAADRLGAQARAAGAGTLTAERARAVKAQLDELFGRLETASKAVVGNSRVLTIAQTTAIHQRVNLELGKAALGLEQATRIMGGRFDVAAVRAAQALASRKYGAANYATLIRRNMADAGPAVDRLLVAGIARGASTADLTRDLATLLKAGDPNLTPYGLDRRDVTGIRTLLSDARRIAVTETNNALREANTQALIQSPIVLAATWTVSGRHAGLPSSPDECDDLAAANAHGLGPGVYRVDDWPLAPHPNCGCTQGGPIIYRPPSEWNRGTGSTPETPEKPQDPTDLSDPKNWPGGMNPNPPAPPSTDWNKPVARPAPPPAPEPPPVVRPALPAFQPARTMAAAEDYAKSQLGVPNVVTDDLPSVARAREWGAKYAKKEAARALEALNRVNAEYQRLLEKYPDMHQGNFQLVIRKSEKKGLAHLGRNPSRFNLLMPMSEHDVAASSTSYLERKGYRWWTVRAGKVTEDTFRHELGHRLDTDAALTRWHKAVIPELQKLRIMQPYGFKLDPAINFRKWVREHISEYATTNEKETVAELFAMVTADDYVRGTLPKVLEDYVDWLLSAENIPSV